MRKLFYALLAGALSCSPAFANWTGKDASSSTVTFYNPGTCTSVVCTPVAQLTDGTNVVTLTTAGANGASNTLTGLPTWARMSIYNGSTWDRWTGAVTVASGGIASGAIASGAIASGAVASGAIAAGALASGAGVDGWDLTQGTKADAAWVSGSGSVIAILKNIAGGVGAAVPAGTNTIGNVGSDPSSGGATPGFAFLAMPATTTTQIVALSGSTKTYVTSLMALAGGTVNVTFKYGTGSNCGTGTTTLAGPYPLTAQAGFSQGAGTGAVMIVPAGQALCITTDASVSGGVHLTYQQK